MNPFSNPAHFPVPQLSPSEIDTNDIKATVGLLSSELNASPLLLSLKHIEAFVEKNVAVLVQRGLGETQNISDYNFTEYGADIVEDELPIIALSSIVLKYEPLTVEQIFFLKPKQLILSMAPPEAFTKEMVQFLHERKITAVGINFLDLVPSRLQDTVKQLVSTLIFSNTIQQSIQLNTLFLKSVYCYYGEICNRSVAEHAGVPWKDLVELCWNWN